MMRLSFLLSLLYSLPCALAEPVLKQVHVIARHGARFPLTKAPSDLTEGTPGLITPKGAAQMYEFGEWLTKYRYLVETYKPELVYFESSPFDRTVVSANLAAGGMFHDVDGTLGAIPVYTQEIEDDMLSWT